MKIPSPSSEIKVASRVICLAIASQFWGCAGPVAQAPFPARNDTVEAGDLLGPFDGRAVDAANGKPLSDAVVFASWGFEVGRGLTAPAGAATVTTLTDSDGRYEIPRLAKLPGGRTRVERFTLIVYKRGYVAYRSDRRFDDLSPRHDFSQRLNTAKLDPAPAGLSHVKHVRFAGGGAPLKRAMAGEIVEAYLELAGGGKAPTAPEGPPLDISSLLSIDELRAATGYTGSFTIEKLADFPSTPIYDSRHFNAADKPESYDAAIRVWKPGSEAELDARWTQLLHDVPHAEVRDEVGEHSIRGFDEVEDKQTKNRYRIYAAATIDKQKGVVVELTCGVDLCRDADQTVSLLKRVLARTDRLGASVEEKPAEEEAPKKPEPAQEKPFQLRRPEMHR
jgi:hypothetical protein